MIKVQPKYIFLYLIGISLLIFGNRQFWEKFQEEKKKKLLEEKMIQEAKIESFKQFETQSILFDEKNMVWKNNHVSFHSIHVGKVNFPALKLEKLEGSIRKETNDDENASDSL